MIYVGLGLLMCHLQAYPSQNTDAILHEKGNPPIRSSPYNKLGHENSIAIPSAVYQKPDQMSHTIVFLDINNWNHTYTSWHCLFSCCAHPGMPQMCHNIDGGQELPDQCL